MSKYLITLTPTGKFFFGGDMTFSSPNQKSEFVSYIIQSNKFPQQTSLLGMLRFLILRNDANAFDEAKQSITNRADAEKLIGPRSFTVASSNDFGVVKKLYPCHLQKKNEDGTWRDIYRQPLDTQKQVDVNDTVSVVLNGKEYKLPKMEHDSKTYSEAKYGSGIKESDIFIEDTRNGIDRDIKTGRTENDALFKQVSYHLAKDYRFSFAAEVDLDLLPYSGQLVSIGGDSSQFVVGIEPMNQTQEDVTNNGSIVVLTSPAYVEDLSAVSYAITEVIPFKCMSTETKNVECYNKRNQLYGYSKKYELYNTGSVFYCSDIDAFTKEIESHEDFRQIGYNHYQVK